MSSDTRTDADLADAEAFALLTRVSQQQNRTLRPVAEDVIRTGTADRTA